MRHMILASLLLGPMAFPTAAVASKPAMDAPTSAQNVHATTGVTAARIVHQSKGIFMPIASLDAGFPNQAKLVLALDLDKKGRTRDIRVVKSEDPYLNGPVVAAVRDFRWRPARLDHHAIPARINLTVLVQQ